MSVEVLKSRTQIDQARDELRRRRLSFTSSSWLRLFRKLGVSDGINVGDKLKSWDVLKTAAFIEKTISKSAPILDIGAYASELLYVLHHLGFSNLTGIDLSPDIKKMAYRNCIRYEVSDFMHTPFEAESFEAISATSVIEHGFNSKALLAEISRLLRPQGHFVASFDYWPQKVNTTDVEFFGMDWKIFSEQEVREFLDEAVAYNLHPRGEIQLDAKERPIFCANKRYTFAWLVLQKGPEPGRVQA
ncbi:MAG TPA: class I SAM-dependent methyltransferase [Candidatus Angelobacter sp.]|nr:class I SAM-dependent methyltransferase [Candidatus Angelobacter sp.]